jgi:hypothetical protein
MDAQTHIRILQQAYAGQLADTVLRYEQAGILEDVTAVKRTQRLQTGAAQAAQLGITAPEEAFTVSATLFGCADWKVEEDDAGPFHAEARHCLLCTMVKRLGGPSPCRVFCLDPIESVVRGLRPGATFAVQETLYEGERCRVRVS